MNNSKPFEYWKLTIAQILPLWIDKVIAIDVDSIVDDDVAELWSQFLTFSPIEVSWFIFISTEWCSKIV